MTHLLSVGPEIKIADAKKIIAMRNRIIHGYDSVDDAVVWNVVIKSLPVLKGDVAKLLE